MHHTLIPRRLEEVLRRRAEQFRIVVVTGPRQAGKSTLCRATFSDRPYATLESPDVRSAAEADPRGFLARFKDGAVLDEVQRLPSLLSYLQEDVDRDPRHGRWILTGSHQLLLMEGVAQSLAGRAAVLHLLPLSFGELRARRTPQTLVEAAYLGGYPAIHADGAPPGPWLSSYVAAYLERDVRSVLRIGDLVLFQTFLQACAGRVGQLLNLSSLGSDVGVSHPTAREWLSVLEATFVAFRLRSFFRNVSKRLMKSPKLYFYDTGVLCSLLGVRGPEDLATHPLRGQIVENWVVVEVLKERLHRGLPEDLRFFRDQKGVEVDLIVEAGTRLIATEIKAGMTFVPDWTASFAGLRAVEAAAGREPRIEERVIYGGGESFPFKGAHVTPWSELDRLAWEPPIG